MNRYARQQQVSVMGPTSAKLLAEAHVLIVGVGGLGSPVSTLLAGAGVGEITLIDSDVVSLSNLHRQTLYQESDIGLAKVTCAKARLTALNSEIKINAINEALTPDNAEVLVNKSTVIVDAADNFLVSYLLSDICLRNRKPLVSASVISTHGYLGVFCGTEQKAAPSMRAVFPVPSVPSQNCSTAGVTGPSVGIIGAYQAQETLKVIVQDPDQLLGKLLYIDAWAYQQNLVDFSAAQEPNWYAEIVSKNSLSNSDFLLDVRSREEFGQDSFYPRATNIPIDDLKSGVFDQGLLTKEKRIVCVCASGQRALNAAVLLQKGGLHNVVVTSK